MASVTLAAFTRRAISARWRWSVPQHPPQMSIHGKRSATLRICRQSSTGSPSCCGVWPDTAQALPPVSPSERGFELERVRAVGGRDINAGHRFLKRRAGVEAAFAAKTPGHGKWHTKRLGSAGHSDHFRHVVLRCRPDKIHLITHGFQLDRVIVLGLGFRDCPAGAKGVTPWPEPLIDTKVGQLAGIGCAQLLKEVDAS